MHSVRFDKLTTWTPNVSTPPRFALLGWLALIILSPISCVFLSPPTTEESKCVSDKGLSTKKLPSHLTDFVR